VKQILGAVALAVVATSAGAQVGHLPQNSPYRDVETNQEFTFFGGHYSAGGDVLGVTPRGGPMFGIRYEKHLGGPAFLMARWSHVNSERNAIDPTKAGAAAQLGRKNVSLNIVPIINLGVGVASCGCTVKPDPYKFGTPFAFSFGSGLRYVPGGRFQLRVDWNDYLYQLKYPTQYYSNTTGTGTAAPSGQARSFWKNNGALTIGASLLFFQ